MLQPSTSVWCCSGLALNKKGSTKLDLFSCCCTVLYCLRETHASLQAGRPRLAAPRARRLVRAASTALDSSYTKEEQVRRLCSEPGSVLHCEVLLVAGSLLRVSSCWRWFVCTEQAVTRVCRARPTAWSSGYSPRRRVRAAAKTAPTQKFSSIPHFNVWLHCTCGSKPSTAGHECRVPGQRGVAAGCAAGRGIREV